MTDKKVIDAHFHVLNEDKNEIISMVKLSPNKDKYMAYKELNLNEYDYKIHCSQFEKVFCIPFFLKEISASNANNTLLGVLSQIPNALAVPVIDNADLEFIKFANVPMIGAKEHFILHEASDVNKRKKAYSFLQKENKFLLIHCSSSLRIDYLQYLRSQFPNLCIQVAHLGCYRRNIEKTYDFINLFANDTKMYFDISTIFDECLIRYVMCKLNYERILFGTDKPFVSDTNKGLIDYITKIVGEKHIMKILHLNALELIGQLTE